MIQTLLNPVTREPNAGFKVLKGDHEPGLYDRVISPVAFSRALVLGCAVETAAMATGQGGSGVVEAVRKASQ